MRKILKSHSHDKRVTWIRNGTLRCRLALQTDIFHRHSLYWTITRGKRDGSSDRVLL